MNPDLLRTIQQHVLAGGHLWLFLDYDGTLVPIAPTPEEARPDRELIALLTTLAGSPLIRVTVLSGRPLSSLREMLPLPGLILAGTYGTEIQFSDGTTVLRAEPAQRRPTIERILAAWAELVAPHQGFLLEDKGIAVALHARHANPRDALVVLPAARAAARELVNSRQFQLLDGDRFLEVAPRLANKGRSVTWLLEGERAFQGLVVYLGDDDKDEDAFAVVRQRGGIAIVVGSRHSSTEALARIPSIESVRRWMKVLRDTIVMSYQLPLSLPETLLVDQGRRCPDAGRSIAERKRDREPKWG